MELVDELMTPGCPQCAIKHLSAALSYSAEAFANSRRYGLPMPELVPEESRILLARAYINLGEVVIGYKSHLWFAVGLLQRAEEGALCECAPERISETARAARLVLEQDGVDGVRRAMQVILSKDGVPFDPVSMEAAHVKEARRELPENDGDYLDYANAIERIRKEYFSLPEATVAEGEENKKQGEPEMATKKSGPVAKTAGKTKVPAATAAKATHAACKGGKCKGKSCKK